jgi:hypothetical protein
MKASARTARVIVSKFPKGLNHKVAPSQTKQLNCQLSIDRFEAFPPSSRSVSKLTRMSSVRALSGYGRGICASRLTAGENPAQVRPAILFAFHGAVPVTDLPVKGSSRPPDTRTFRKRTHHETFPRSGNSQWRAASGAGPGQASPPPGRGASGLRAEWHARRPGRSIRAKF